jgi:hypothetical protein
MLGTFFLALTVAFPQAPPPPVHVVLPSAAAAARVRIVGASPAEAAAARKALGQLGARSPVRRVVFGHQAGGRSIAVFVRTLPGDPTRGFESEWLGHAFLSDVAARLEALGTHVTWFELAGDGYAVDAEPQRARSRRQLFLLTKVIAARADEQGHDVVKVVGYPSGSGAVEVVIRLSRNEFLRGTNTRWRDVLGRSFDAGYSACVLVLGPGGVPISYSANFGRNAGAGGFGPPGRAGVRPIPPLSGQVSLRVTVERMLPESRSTFALDCSQSATRCDAFRRQWVYLIPPTAEDEACSPPAGIGQLTVTGSVDGIDVERRYDGCYATTVLRWEKLLGVPTRR